MRILLVAHAYPPRSTAGVEVYTRRIGKALSRLGHRVRVLTAAHDLRAATGTVRSRSDGDLEIAEIVNVHDLGTLQGTYRDPRIDAAVGGVVEDFGPDVVHVQHLLNLSLGVLEHAATAGVPTFMTLHDYWLSCPRDGLRQREDLSICEKVDHAVCAACLQGSPYLVPPLQSSAASWLRRLGLAGALPWLCRKVPALAAGLTKRARSVAPARQGSLAREMDERVAHLQEAFGLVDRFLAPTEFARARAIESGLAPQSVTTWRLGAVAMTPRARAARVRRHIGFIGTLSPHKGVHVLIEAFRRIPDASATLSIHGSPDVAPAYSASLRRESAADGRIRLLGAFEEGRQPDVLAGLDVLAVPSVWWENSPLTVLEALAAGLPVVASQVGGIPELLPSSEAGALVPPGDAGALAEVLGDIVAGRRFAEALPPVAVKTVDEEALALAQLYTESRAA